MRRSALLAVLACATIANAATPVGRQPSIPSSDAAQRPDFSAVTSRRAAEALVRDGRLVRVSIFPTELGGPDEPENYTFVPPAVAYTRTTLVLPSLKRLSRKSGATHLDAEPEYRGNSFIPARIRYTLSTSAKDPNPVAMTLEIW